MWEGGGGGREGWEWEVRKGESEREEWNPEMRIKLQRIRE